MDEGLGLFFVICGVIGLIFFVKMWFMTGDVSKIQKNVAESNKNLESIAKKMANDIKEIKGLLKEKDKTFEDNTKNEHLKGEQKL